MTDHLGQSVARPFLLYGQSGPHHPPDPDPDFPVVGTVRYELHSALDGPRCCIKRVEVVAICENRDEARQWMLDHDPVPPNAPLRGRSE